MAQMFMIYADEERAKICANHKHLRHLRAKKQSAALDRGEYTPRWDAGRPLLTMCFFIKVFVRSLRSAQLSSAQLSSAQLRAWKCLAPNVTPLS
ncbi:MAG: hypothetical protein LBG47_04530 [Prevotellaceae bacterium]|jgi:hypothetical protein|nr:hypothetical protein [Prevotellaceae bacterium]